MMSIETRAAEAQGANVAQEEVLEHLNHSLTGEEAHVSVINSDELECKYGRKRDWVCTDYDFEDSDYDDREIEGNWYDV